MVSHLLQTVTKKKTGASADTDKLRITLHVDLGCVDLGCVDG